MPSELVNRLSLIQALLIANYVVLPAISTLQLMERRVVQLMRPIIAMQFAHVAVAASRFVTVVLRGHGGLLYRRAISRTLLHEPALPDPEPDDAAKGKE